MVLYSGIIESVEMIGIQTVPHHYSVTRWRTKFERIGEVHGEVNTKKGIFQGGFISISV